MWMAWQPGTDHPLCRNAISMIFSCPSIGISVCLSQFGGILAVQCAELLLSPCINSKTITLLFSTPQWCWVTFSVAPQTGSLFMLFSSTTFTTADFLVPLHCERLSEYDVHRTPWRTAVMHSMLLEDWSEIRNLKIEIESFGFKRSANADESHGKPAHHHYTFTFHPLGLFFALLAIISHSNVHILLPMLRLWMLLFCAHSLRVARKSTIADPESDGVTILIIFQGDGVGLDDRHWWGTWVPAQSKSHRPPSWRHSWEHPSNQGGQKTEG